MIAVDATRRKLSVSGSKALLKWNAMDVQGYEVFGIEIAIRLWTVDSILFLKEALRYCSNRILVPLDRRPWRPPVLEHLACKTGGR